MKSKTFKDKYEHGLGFSEILYKNIMPLYKRVYDLNKAGLLIIDGGIGEGKTTLAVQIADEYNKKHKLPEINIRLGDQLALGGKDFTKKLRICFKKKLPVLIYDEAGDFNKRGSLTRFNAMINRTFETFRAFKIIVILVLPSFHVIDNDLFDKNIPRLLLHTFKRSKRQGNFKGYSLYRMMYIKDKMRKLVVKPFAYDIVDPNFYGHFKDLSEERSKELDKVSTKGKLKELQKAEISMEGLLSTLELATRLNVNNDTIRRYIKDLKLTPFRVINKMKYYKEELIDSLADYQDKMYNQRIDNRAKTIAKKKGLTVDIEDEEED